MSASRRLAAILSADVVGFSRLMEIDEVETLDRLKALRRDLVDPQIAGHSGRIVKLMGDGVLVEFASIVDAVQCAVAIQEAMPEAEPDQPEERRIKFRIGVNLGDVIVDGDDIYGDGVNVAARLQSLASPGGVTVSATVHEHVAGKLGVTFEDLGVHAVKNIERPVRVYRAEIGDQVKPVAASGGSAKEPIRSEKASIAVLPFDNMSGDPEQGYFSDGITEDIITGLSRFRELLVIARNSSFQFRGKAIDVKEVAQKLNVHLVLEGSVRKVGNRVRVTVQLIDAVSAAHIWAEQYDRDLTDVFDIQDEITRMVTTRVALQVRAAINHRTRSQPTRNLSAYDNFLRALELNGNYDTQLQAEPFLRKAIELDPSFAVAHGMMSYTQSIKYFYDNKREHLEDALICGQRALDLDPEEPLASCAVGFALMFMHRFDEAGHYLDRAVSLNPNDVQFLAIHAIWMNYTGQTERAFQEITEALRRDPYATDWFWDIRGSIQTAAGKYRDAIASYQRMKSLPPWGYCYLVICHVELGELAEAKGCLEKLRQISSGRTPEQVFSIEPFADDVMANRLVDALRRAEAAKLPE